MATILIVDDRPANREYLVTLLGYLGHRMLEAADGAEALALARTERPDLVIADIVMPRMDGYEFARQLRAEPAIAATKIIYFTSSFVVAETLQLAGAVGVAHIITKPAEPEQIIATVSAALEAPPVPFTAPPSAEFHQEHMRLLTDVLAKKVEELEAEIVERKAAEAQLRLQSTALNAAANAIVITDRAGIIQWVNPAFTELTGYAAEAVRGRSPRLLNSGQQPPEFYEQMWATIAAGQVWHGELVNRRQDGSLYIQEQTITPLVSAGGQITHFIAIQQDVTARREAERQIRHQAMVLENVSDGIVSTDLQLRIQSWNAGAERMFGYQATEVIGRPYGEVMAYDYLDADDASIGRQVAEMGRWQGEVRAHHKDGPVLYVLVAATMLFDNQGQVSGFSSVLHDITERKQRERELEAIAAVTKALRMATTQAQMLPLILAQVMALLEAGSAALELRDEHTDELVVAQGQGDMAGLTGRRLAPGAGMGGHVLATGQPYVTANVLTDPYFHPLNEAGSIRAAACVPLLTSQRVVGVLWAGRLGAFAAGEVQVLSAVADIAAGALQRARLHEQTEARLQQLAALRQIDQAIMNSLDLQTTLLVLLNHVVAQLAVEACDILLLNRSLNVLEYSAGRGFRSTAIGQTRMRLGEGYAGQAALERRVMQVPNLRLQPAAFERGGLLANENLEALYCAPLVAKGQVVGVLEVWNRTPVPRDAEWLAFLETLAEQAAIAVADARQFSDLQRSNAEMRLAYDTTLEGWSAALDLRDKDTEGHSRRVTELTLQLARALGVSGNELEQMRRGALLHDIGKMGIPDSILHKAGPLTDDEQALMRQHPQLAYQLLAPIHFLRPALDIPYCHHEWWDGNGYPRQLKGDVIPLAARIFAVVDVWDALCSDRPYRSGWPEDRVRAYLLAGAGKQFDPEVVHAFLALPKLL